MSIPLPPTARDFLAYQRIVVDAASTRTVAEELKVSQTRVRQIVHRVLDWMQQTLPQDAELTEEAQLRVAQHIAADRLERYYCEANRAWLQTTQVKFANLVLKVIAAQSKLPAMPGTLEALAMDAILGPLPDEVQSPMSKVQGQPAAPTACAVQTTLDLGAGTLDSIPPARDCSPKQESPPSAAVPEPSSAAATPSAPTSSSGLPPTTSAARRAFFAPAHQREGDAPAEPESGKLKRLQNVCTLSG